jgi:hypothetical protein
VLPDYSCFTLHRFSSRVLTLCPLIVLLSTAGQDHDRDALAAPARNSATTASTICVSISGLSVPTSAVISSLLAVNNLPGLA